MKKRATTQNYGRGNLALLVLGAFGVVYGDIGTSPLYALNEMFFKHGDIGISPENVYGAIGLVLWAITIVVALKYTIFVLRADQDSEGGVFALLSLINKKGSKGTNKGTAFIILLLILAAGLLFGDGMITPAISVISAVEGLGVATPSLQPYIISITIAILTALFLFQRKGTAKVGGIFGPIAIIWFAAISILGLGQIIHYPGIIRAFNPYYIILLLRHTDFRALLLVLGSVMLVVTGGEALYADMGHFGKKAIRISWFSMVYPALLLNYLGQGAYLLSGQAIRSENIFYSMVPGSLLYPMIILATFATIIASQALISGGFSLASQAVGLGLFPRLRIIHTHNEHEGQIYVPFVNWMLYAGCVLLVVIFKASTNLASAYGLAVSGVMLITSLGMYSISRTYWNWSVPKSLALFGFFAIIDASFLFANSLKFLDGGFVPLLIGLTIFALMTTWQWGRRHISAAYAAYPTLTVKEIIKLKEDAENSVPRSIVILAPDPITALTDKVTPLLQIIWDRFHVLPKDIIFLTVEIIKEPFLHTHRYKVTKLQNNNGKGSVTSVVVHFGFMEDPNVESILENLAAQREIQTDEHPKNWIIYSLQERVIPEEPMNIFQQIRFRLFQLLLQNSTNADEYFSLGRDIGLSTEVLAVKLK